MVDQISFYLMSAEDHQTMYRPYTYWDGGGDDAGLVCKGDVDRRAIMHASTSRRNWSSIPREQKLRERPRETWSAVNDCVQAGRVSCSRSGSVVTYDAQARNQVTPSPVLPTMLLNDGEICVSQCVCQPIE
jgi:hypothetical protein